MERAVVTERLLELIAEREVRAALFTTYTFEPDFFELEVVPLLLNQNSAYSEDDRVKRFMVRENLREADLPIDVYYDSPMFRKIGDRSPDMEYLCHGVNLGNRAFHGKVNMILVQDRDTGKESLLLGAGSNNLSRAGWWDNIECQHWEEVSSNECSVKLVKKILPEEIKFLNSHRELSNNSTKAAIDRISEFLSNCHGSNNAATVHYFGLSYPDNHHKFLAFLRQRPSPIAQSDKWRLEIISPFFADSESSKVHQDFLDMGVEEITLLLPTDDKGNALCKDDYYHHIQGQEHIRWGEWREDAACSLGLTGDYYRPLHAKVYHFYRGHESWVFVGSVNFTYMAMHKNVEAGFLVQQNKSVPLLKAFADDKVVEHFAEIDEPGPGEEIDEEDGVEIPNLFLSYDWVSRRLAGRTSQHHAYEIEIVGPEGKSVIAPWALRYQESVYEGDVGALEKALRNGSLVKVRGHNIKRPNKPGFPEHIVLLQQVGWSHKPLDLPTLTATQILAIYAGMSIERRQMMLIDARIRELVLSAQGGELTIGDDDSVINQFFCEYAEIFRAFGQLRERLKSLREDERYDQVDYYLTGSGVDSLPSLLSLLSREHDKNEEEKSSLSPATCYLVSLSALEVYENEHFNKSPNVAAEVKKLRTGINSLKKGNRLVLEDNTDRKKFFDWFEDEFSRVYKIVGNSS